MAYKLQRPQSHLRRGGIPFSFPQTPTGRSQNLEMSVLSGVIGHFGPINKYLEVLVLDTGFRYLLALNGRNLGSGVNAHLAVHTPHRRLKGPKPEGSII